MITRFLLLIIVTTSLSSFKQGKRDYVHFLNLNNVDTIVQNKLIAFKVIPEEVNDNKTFSVTRHDLSHKEKIEDLNVIEMVRGLMVKFKYDPMLFQKSNSFSMYSLGEMKLNVHTVTKLLYVEARDLANDKVLKIILGINMVDNRIVSVIELSRNLRLAGWSSYTYSTWSKNKFKIIYAVPTCVIGSKIRRSPLDSYTVKMKNDGKLD
ncbi:MAG: hypothetical protein WC756_20675 [Taibaiella sp.]|jgi:hypothetical protein